MVTKVQKWGNSIGVRIPKAYAEEAKVVAGSPVEVYFEDGQLVIKPVRRFELDSLLKGVTKKNLHEETDTGEPVGSEAW